MTTTLPADHPCLTPIWTRKELLAAGYTDTTIRAARKAGVIHRIRHGAYVDGSLWLAFDAATRHALLARSAYGSARVGSVISHASALPFYEAPVWGFDLSEAHLTRDDHKAGRHEAGVQQHRGIILPEDVCDVHGLRVMSPTRTALELTTLDSPEAALVAVCFLLHTGQTTPDALVARLEKSITTWPDTLSTRRILGLADARVESPLEARFLHLCWLMSLPRPTPQVEVRDRDGALIGRVDFAWPALRVFVELDGKEKYLKYRRPGESIADAVAREKAREDRIRELTGWRCIRLTWADLASPERTAARIRAVLAGLAA